MPFRETNPPPRPDLLHEPHYVKRLALYARRKLTGQLMGNYASRFKGRGLAFRELREYQPGDNIKDIDWKVTARTGKPYIRSYHEERSMDVLLLFDASLSVNQNYIRPELNLSAKLAALFCTVSAACGDRTGAIVFDSAVRDFYRPARSKHQVSQIISSLATSAKEKQSPTRSDLSGALKFLNSSMKRLSLVVIVSDFICDDFEAELAKTAYRFDTALVLVSGDKRTEMAAVGLVDFTDPETLERVTVDLSSKRIRDALKKADLQHRDKIKRIADKTGSAFAILKDDPLKPLLEISTTRARRR